MITDNGLMKNRLRELKYSIDYPIKEGDSIYSKIESIKGVIHVVYTEPKEEVKISKNTQIELYGIDYQRATSLGLGIVTPYEEYKKRGLVNKNSLKI
jgi:hypothetical protein